MSLLSLPLELFQAVIEDTIYAVGLQNIVKLRLISKFFDAEIQRALYALPVLDDIENIVPNKGLCLPERMSIVLTSKLLHLKMRSHNASRRPFCLAVNRTVAFLEELGSEHVLPIQEITDVMIEHAASSWALPELILWLSPTKTPPDVFCDIENAMIFAVATNRPALLQELLKQGGDINSPGTFLVTPLTLAGKVASENIIRLILDHELRDKANVDEAGAPFVRHRLRKIILKTASRKGRENIVRIVLHNKYHTGQPGRGYSKAINNAIEGNHQSIAVMLLLRRRPVSGRPAYWEKNWYKRICTEIVSRNLLDVMRAIIEKGCIIQAGYLDAPFKQALKGNQLEMASLIASNAAPTDVTSFPEALNAASEDGHCEIFDILLARLETIDIVTEAMNEALVTAADHNHLHMVQHILAKGLDVTRHNGGIRALAKAASRGSHEIVQLLLDSGTSAKQTMKSASDSGEMELGMEKAKKDHPEVFALILERAAMEGVTEVTQPQDGAGVGQEGISVDQESK